MEDKLTPALRHQLHSKDELVAEMTWWENHYREWAQHEAEILESRLEAYCRTKADALRAVLEILMKDF